MATLQSLLDAYTVGLANQQDWSYGVTNPTAFLKVLPNPDVKTPYASAWTEWQKGQSDYKNGNYTYADPNGLYYSSWGPASDVVDLELKLSSFNELFIPGLGTLVANNTTDESVYNDDFQFYNGTTGASQGPLIVVDPGDTVKIKLVNDLPEASTDLPYYDKTNLHFHGLHVSAQGDSDNVLITIDRGESWEVEVKIPDDHFVGPDWYHPHLHGATNVQVSKGLAGPFLIQPSTEETDDLDNFNPVSDPVYWMSLQTWGLNQQERAASSEDPVNQDSSGTAYRIATPPEHSVGADGGKIYTVSEAGYIGYNYMPDQYSAATPDSGDAYYGFGLNGDAIENIIHTVNGQYNPTIEAKVGEWNLFGFLNFSVNAHHVIQLLHEHEGELSLEEFQLVAVDGDVAGAAKDGITATTETPVIAPGARMTLQHAFTKPGKYYFLSNGTNEILGEDLAPDVTNTLSQSSVTETTYNGFNDGHLVWGPQVLTTVEVTGDAIDTQPEAPEPWNYITKEQEEIDAWMSETDGELDKGTLKQREFVWSAMDFSYPMFGSSNGTDLEPQGSSPSDNDPSSFEGAYRINGRFFGHTPQEQSVVAMPMLGTTEEWTVVNKSYKDEGKWGEWHPFHIHQNDFVVTEINGLSTDEITAYPTNQLADTVVLGGAYINGTQTAGNPYGQAAGSTTENVEPFTTKIRMRFEDFPGAYVNHCHILFHEDAGMMQAVKVILNTNSTFLATDQAQESITLRLGSETDHSFQLKPYEDKKDNQNVNVAIGDVNYGKFFNAEGLNNDVNYKSGIKGYSDNITDVITLQKSQEGDKQFTIRVFDGDALKQASTGRYKMAGFAPISADDMKDVVINEDADLKQLTLSGDIYLEKASSDPDDHSGAGGTGTWNLSRMEGTTYIHDVYNTDGSYGGWNASTDPSEIIGLNGATIPSSYPDGSFVFSSKDGKDTLVATELHDSDEVDDDGQGFEQYYIQSGTGRFKGASGGEISGLENFYGGADITLYSDSESPIMAKPKANIDGSDENYILKDITPFANIDFDEESETSLAVGDIDGDGHSDIIAGIGGKNLSPRIEIYSGADYSLMGRIRPFDGVSTSINIAAGDINSDNFVDIIVGQGEGGTGRVEAYTGRLIFDVIKNNEGASNGDSSVQNVNPLKGNALAQATALFTDEFRPFASDDYTGAVDVSSGYILPRPEYQQTADELDQVIQSSFANLIALKVNSESTKKSPSIKTYYYTGGSGHAAHTTAASARMEDHSGHDMSHATADIPTFESALNINQSISSINGSFMDLSQEVDDRGYGTLIGELEDGRQYAYYIETDSVQDSDTGIFKHQKTSLTPGDTVKGTSKANDLVGTKGNDKIVGKKGADTLKGLVGDDVLRGNKGADILKGKGGNDRLFGGNGNNTLKGGNGNDTFVAGSGQDQIIDFDPNDDVIEVTNSSYIVKGIDNGSEISFLDANSDPIAKVTLLGIEAAMLTSNDLITTG